MTRGEFEAMARSDHIEKKVSAKDFCRAFAGQWEDELPEKGHHSG